MSKRRRQAAWGHPPLAQPAFASLLSLVLLLALSPPCTLLAQAAGGREGTTSEPTTGTISGVITAQETLLTNQRLATQLLGQRLVTSVALIKALGGGWDAASLQSIGVQPVLRQAVAQ